MPRYDFRCSTCGVFEAEGDREQRQALCPQGHPAERLPFSGLPYLKGETMPKQIPDEAYRTDAEKRAFERAWGPEERAAEMLRASVTEDNQGRKFVDTKAMSAT